MLVTWFDASRRDDYLTMAARLRGLGLGVEVFPEPRKLGVQLKYADEKGIEVAVVAGDQEWEAGRVQVKDLRRKIAIGVDYSHASPEALAGAILAVLDESDRPRIADDLPAV